ncbi:hypothetical protein BGZ89_001385 [Linnemannia elongata]|nr:hypothetical protein BGZ89_001385 [Linnemannia elongata]
MSVSHHSSRNFTLSDQSSALADYADVLTSSELSAKRCKILQGAHNIFMKSRLPDFWTSWKQQLALDKVQRELDTSSATTAKKTALLAQEACLRESARSFGNLKQENTSTSTVSIENDTVVYEQDEEQSYQSDSNATTIEPCIALSLSSRTRPFHPLISYVFKKAQDQHAVLLSSIPSDLSGVLREMYSVAFKELSKPGSVVDKKDVLGELVSKASTQARQKAESEYGPTSSAACGRKVDMSIRIRFDDNWRHEVAIFEFKATTATQAMCEKQQKKSVRLNAALLYDLEAKGLDITKSYPIIAEGQALGLDFYALRRYDEILGARRSATKGISLPSHEHLREYAFEVTDVLANSAPTPFGYVHDSDDEEDEVNASTPDPSSRPSTPPSTKRRPGSFVLFSPSKKNKLGTRAEDVSESWDDGDDDYGNT